MVSPSLERRWGGNWAEGSSQTRKKQEEADGKDVIVAVAGFTCSIIGQELHDRRSNGEEVSAGARTSEGVFGVDVRYIFSGELGDGESDCGEPDCFA